MTVQVMQAAEVRANWRKVLDAALTREADTVIERSGKPIAALIPHDDYVALQEELEDLRDARLALPELEAWRADPDTGRPYSEIRAEMVDQGLLDG